MVALFYHHAVRICVRIIRQKSRCCLTAKAGNCFLVEVDRNAEIATILQIIKICGYMVQQLLQYDHLA